MKIIDFLNKKVLEAGTQTAVSRKTGVSQGTITKILNGDTNPELATIAKIAAAYGISLIEFDEISASGDKKYPVVAAQAEAASQVDTSPAEESYKILEKLAGYSPEVRLAADYMEMKVKGKTPEERLRCIEEIMDQIRDKLK